MAAAIAAPGALLSPSDSHAANANFQPSVNTGSVIVQQDKAFPLSGDRALGKNGVGVRLTPTSSSLSARQSNDKCFGLLAMGTSYHLTKRSFIENGKERAFNEFNPGIAVERCLTDKFHVMAGTYKNSIHKQTFYIGAGWEWRQNKKIGYGVEGGFLTGYNISPVVPGATPYLRVGPRDSMFSMKFGLIPLPTAPSLTVQARINLNKIFP